MSIAICSTKLNLGFRLPLPYITGVSIPDYELILIVGFNSIEQILAKIQQQPGWEQYQQYCQLLECWQNTVTQITAKYTRPLYIKREVLWVATSSSARAQELSFQRYYLLKKLNSQLPFSLKDIRFSASGWNTTIEPNQKQDAIVNKNQKPATNLNSKKNLKRSPVVEPEKIDSKPSINKLTLSPQAAVRRWIELASARSNEFNSCPQCGSPTPEAELKRWNLCHHCIAKEWSIKYRPPFQCDRD